MGGGSWTATDWSRLSNNTISQAATVDDLFTQRGLADSFNPFNVKIRESRDSSDNPESTAIILATDVSGSMSPILEKLVREALKTTMEEIYDRKPVTNPQIMIMGIDDVRAGNPVPLQTGQFESDIRIAESLLDLYLEGMGGGNGSESYILAWYFAALHTSIDCFEKRGKKGFIFTMGDDGPTPDITAAEIKKVLGYKPEFDKLTAKELLAMVSKQYEVYHFIFEQGDTYSERIVREWRALLGERAIPVADYTKMGEIIVSTLQVFAGVDKQDILDSWDGTTKLAVKRAISGLTTTGAKSTGLVTF